MPADLAMAGKKLQPAGLFYRTTAVYDPAHPDEERIPFDDPRIGFDWRTQPR